MTYRSDSTSGAARRELDHLHVIVRRTSHDPSGRKARRAHAGPSPFPSLRSRTRSQPAITQPVQIPALSDDRRHCTRALGVRARDGRVDTRTDERGQDGRRGLGDTLGVAPALDAMRARALRERRVRPRHDARARRSRRELRRRARADHDRRRRRRCLLRSCVLPATLSDTDASASTSTSDSTSAGSSAPSAAPAIDSLHVAPTRDGKETGWI